MVATVVTFLTTHWLGQAILILLECLAVTVPLLVAVAYLTYVDRKVSAAMQLRQGPNVGRPVRPAAAVRRRPQAGAKETIIPSSANKVLFLLAPMLTFMPALVAWAVIPFDDGWVLADINVGILYLFAISSLGVYGIIMAGWASNSKYAFLGALRSAAQMVSLRGLDRLRADHRAAAASARSTSPTSCCAQAGWFWNWYWLPLLPMFVIFFVSALAETNRTPFDLPEGEAELVAGYPRRILGDGLRAVLPRRIRQHDPVSSAGVDPVPRRLAVADPVSRRSPGSRASIWFVAQDRVAAVRLLLGRAHAAPLPLRPDHAAGLEGVPARLAGLDRPHRRRAAVRRLGSEALEDRIMASLDRTARRFLLAELVSGLRC